MSMAQERKGMMGLTTQQREFVLAITDALTKYSPEGVVQPEDVMFLSATDSLISETVRLDYALRTVGSGGPGMERANVFRNLLRKLRELLSDSAMKPDWLKITKIIHDIDDTTGGLQTALEDFIGITFNEKLMDSLTGLRNTLKMHSADGLSCDHGDSTTQLEHDLASSFSSLQKHLEKFIDEDIRNIKSVQNDANQGYVNLTVIATFLSGVTASVLQIVGPTTSGNSILAVTVNASLFSSLVFSTASAAQSLLAMMWMQSFVRLPEKNLPHLLYAWLRRGPLISLLVSGALFAVGLIVFVYASHQDPVTSVITTCFATIQTLGVLSLTILFVRDRWKFRRERGITGLKLTKFSILFSAIEAIERVVLYMFCSSRPSPECGHSPTYGTAESSFNLNVSESNDDPNGGMPRPLYFQAHTAPSNPIRPLIPTMPSPLNGMTDDGKHYIVSLFSNRTEAVEHLVGPTNHSLPEVQHFTPAAIRIHTNDDGQNIAIPIVNRLPPAPSASVREVQHFNPNKTAQVAVFNPPFARPSASKMEISHFGKQNPDSRIAVPTMTLGKLSGYESEAGNPTSSPKPPIPAQSASTKEIKHFDARKSGSKKGGGNRPGKSNPAVRFASLPRPDDPIPFLPSYGSDSNDHTNGIQGISPPSASTSASAGTSFLTVHKPPRRQASESASAREIEHFHK